MSKLKNGAVQHFALDAPAAPGYIFHCAVQHELAETFRRQGSGAEFGPFPLTGETLMDNKPIEAPPASTLRETAVKPMLAIKATNPTPTQGLNTVINSTQDFVASGKANVEALAASGQIWVAGVQDLTKQCVTTAKASYEESVAAFKALSAAKSVEEAIDLQGTYSKAMIATTLANRRSSPTRRSG